MTTFQLGGGDEPVVRLSAPERERGEWPDHFVVEIVGVGINAHVSVENPPYAPALGEYFRELASSRVAWPGVREWRSSEDEFAIRSTCDPAGHVRIEFEFRPGFGAPQAWRASAAILVGLGSVGNIANEIEEMLAYARP